MNRIEIRAVKIALQRQELACAQSGMPRWKMKARLWIGLMDVRLTGSRNWCSPWLTRLSVPVCVRCRDSVFGMRGWRDDEFFPNITALPMKFLKNLYAHPLAV